MVWQPVQKASVEVEWFTATLTIMPPAPITAAMSNSTTKSQRLICIVVSLRWTTLLTVFERRNECDELPNLLIAEHGPRRHRRVLHAVSDDEKGPASGGRFRPWRQGQVRGQRIHPFPALAATVGAGPVADGAVGHKNNAAGLLGLSRAQHPGRRAWRRFALTSRN